MADRDWKSRRDANGAALMLMLKRVAEAERQCPDAEDIARSLKLTANMVTTLFDDLRKAKRIDWQIVYCGNGVGKRRWVHLLKEGISTVKPQGQRRSYVKAPPSDDALSRAKRTLQARGCYVWDARVTGGPAGMVRVDRNTLTPEAVIAMAGL